MNNKGLRIILITCIALLAILFIILINLSNIDKNKDDSNAKKPEVSLTMSDDVIIPENSYLFFGKYVKGDLTSKEIYESINEYGKNKKNSKLVKIEFDENSISQTKTLTSAKLTYTYENNEKVSVIIKVPLRKSIGVKNIEYYE